MERKTTLKELAKLLNLSVSTISKALNDTNDISYATKEKVRKAALEHNYVPNELAQVLKGKKSKTIGVIIPDVLAHFFAQSLHSIETTASNLGYKIIICISNESLEKEAESIKVLFKGSIDGLIVSLARETQAKASYEHFSRATTYGVPIVLFDRVSDALQCDRITINDAESAKKATQELLQSGCRNVLFLSTISNTSVGIQRNSGYDDMMQSSHLDPKELHIKDYKNFEEKLLSVLQTTPVDGILAADELSAVSAMKTALKNGYKIPEDISVIGFTNGILGEKYIPSLTTVEQHAEEQGKKAVETLVARIEKTLPGKPVNEVIKTSIIHRESTKPIFSLLKL